MSGFFRSRLVVFASFIALSFWGCAADSTPGRDATGSLSLELTIADGFEIEAVMWTISGGSMPDMTGTINTSASGSTASIEVFGLPAGSGYAIDMEATSTDGDLSCKGSATFAVTVGQVTNVHVMLNCKTPEHFGGVRVDGKFNICPDLTKVVVSPLQTSVGNDIDLLAAATDDDGDPIAYRWTSVNGSIADPTATSTTYTCIEAGADSITITVSDDAFAYCMSGWTVAVTCVMGDGSPCDGVACEDDGNECTREACDPGTGACESSSLDGVTCDEGAGLCDAGECVDADQCASVVCEDLGECQSNLCDPSTGECNATTVEDGTSCNNGVGSCTNGSCVELDRCLGVFCEELGECRSNACNQETGACEASDIADGTSCDGGAGECSGGDCVAIDRCAAVICEDLGECRSNTCSPGTGVCGAADVADGTSCNGGAGTCTSGQCAALGTPLLIDYSGTPAAFSGQEVVFVVEVSNTTASPVTNVVVVVDLPDSGSFVSSDPSASPSGDSLTLNLGDIPGNASTGATITWLAPASETTLVSVAVASGDDAGAASDDHEIPIGAQTVVTGGATVAGTGLRHRASGEITITGVPAGAIVTRAVLVWAVLYQNTAPSNAITFEDQVVTPDLTQTISDDLCWNDTDTIGFAADVTALVPGNGIYSVTNPVNGIIRLDDIPVPTFPVTDGASLVVFYGAPGLDAQVLSDFSYSAESEGVNARTLAGIASIGGAATLYLAGPDGQANFGEQVRVIGASVLNLDGTWDGSDPQVAPNFFLGNLWDTDVHDVTALLPAGQTTLQVQVGAGTDCTGLSAVVLEVEQ